MDDAKVIEELLNELEYRYSQTICGCHHPYCKRCMDDIETKQVIRKSKQYLLKKR